MTFESHQSGLEIPARLAQRLLIFVGTMSVENRLSSSVVVVACRRRAPRVPTDDRIGVEIVTVLVPAKVIDVSIGGFSVETPCSLRIGAVHLFRFVMVGGRELELTARVIHSRRKAADDETEHYISGCEFLHDAAMRTDDLVDELVQAAIAV